MNIKYKDIGTISSALWYAYSLLSVKVKELEEKGFNDIANEYKSEKGKIEEAITSLLKIRKELHLKDDYAYNQKFKSE